MKKPIVLIWLVIIFSWSGVIWLMKSGDSGSKNSQALLFLLLFFAVSFLASFIIFLVRIIVKRGQDERVVFKSSFWWTVLIVSVILLGKFLDTRKMLDGLNALILLGIIVSGSMFLRLGLRRGYSS